MYVNATAFSMKGLIVCLIKDFVAATDVINIMNITLRQVVSSGK